MGVTEFNFQIKRKTSLARDQKITQITINAHKMYIFRLERPIEIIIIEILIIIIKLTVETLVITERSAFLVLAVSCHPL